MPSNFVSPDPVGTSNQGAIQIFDVTIGAGAALSGTIDFGGLIPVGISIPAGWTAASLTYQTSLDGGTTWANLFTGTAEVVSSGAAAGAYIVLDPTIFSSLRWLRLRSGTLATPVNQVSAATIRVVGRVSHPR